MTFNKTLAILMAIILISSCKKEDEDVTPTPQPSPGPKLIVKLSTNPNQERLGNLGQPTSIPAGNAGQNPTFNKISAHYFELAPTAFTALGAGQVLYHAPETTTGGSTAINFSQSKIVNPGDIFLEIPIKDIAPGNYSWVRLSLSYQNYDLQFYFNGLALTGTVASFVGFNTYISKFPVKNQELTVNANKLQGFWAFETINGITSGQAPAGATTVPNPLFASSPIPAGSCVVTGQFAAPLQITGNETSNITINMSLSVNKSFEWVDTNGNGKWDVEPGANENVVDMGLRGLVPIIE
jgi:hypothetical protein